MHKTDSCIAGVGPSMVFADQMSTLETHEEFEVVVGISTDENIVKR